MLPTSRNGLDKGGFIIKAHFSVLSIVIIKKFKNY